MDVEIVLNQHDGPGVREMDIGQVFQDVSIIDGGVAVRDFAVYRTFERCEQHEEIGHAVAVVLIVMSGRASRLQRYRHTRFGKELL